MIIKSCSFVEQAQNILVLVFNLACTSNPMIGSNLKFDNQAPLFLYSINQITLLESMQ